MKEQLTYFFEKYFELSKKEMEIIQSFFEPQYLKKETFLLQKGQMSDFIIFISEGVLRVNEIDAEGNDKTKFFFNENQFLTNLDSYNLGIPAQINIKTVTACDLFVIKKMDTLKIPRWTEIFNVIVQKELTNKINNQYAMRTQSATEKYKNFLVNSGNIVNRVPLKYIASYLGIEPQTLSRVRRQM